MNSRFKKYIMFLAFISLTSVLSACSSDSTAINSESSNSELKNKNSQTIPANNQSLGSSSNFQNTSSELSINHRCTGCGRCSLFDPEHFSSSRGRSIPRVISQNNLDSAGLQRAIVACPVDAIELG